MNNVQFLSIRNLLPILLLLVITGCSDFSSSVDESQKPGNLKGEYIYRKKGNKRFVIDVPKLQKREVYSWEEGQGYNYTKITKEFFRCKGSSTNPAQKAVSKSGKLLEYYDCGGCTKHSLPLIHGKEGVYPILIDLLNYIQKRFDKRVIITCGHRCPDHNTYSDRTKLGRVSKHMIGAEVDFYVEGLEYEPQKVVDAIFDFYKEMPVYTGRLEYQKFKRYHKNDAHVAVKPWYNKEIYMKLVGEEEGRDWDNSHPYPYINLQVRYDRQKEERVSYSWNKAHKGYFRW